jgi:hypothetical protein
MAADPGLAIFVANGAPSARRDLSTPKVHHDPGHEDCASGAPDRQSYPWHPGNRDARVPGTGLDTCASRHVP